jgi:hypothetical protein
MLELKATLTIYQTVSLDSIMNRDMKGAGAPI